MILIAVTIVAVLMCGCSDDPFYPRSPSYWYRAQVTGLDGFTVDDGTAVIRLPLPAWNGTPIRQEGWQPFDGIWEPEQGEDVRGKYHGTTSVALTNTSFGPMLEVTAIMTDYYLSYARVTPVVISPGQNTSVLLPIVPDRIEKNLSFDVVYVQDTGYAGPWEYAGNGMLQDRQDVLRFVDAPLVPTENRTGTGNYSTYVYIDDRLRPLGNGSSLNLLVRLKVMLNHNFVNASIEGARLFEYHDYTIRATIPGDVTGYVPVRVEYAYSTNPYYRSLR